ncbi:cysteine-rich venom protein [Aplysia californica]|uniref:Cysteine-rich venom protein n=1 Tax=Aplysia californica TaxID=6500 RepID=A0ABM1A3Q0_APLCA|nr:cysteine-rich venom protein [Aplysia californica]
MVEMGSQFVFLLVIYAASVLGQSGDMDTFFTDYKDTVQSTDVWDVPGSGEGEATGKGECVIAVVFILEMEASGDGETIAKGKVWDDKLAAVAQKWAKQCVLEHDKNRKIPSYGLKIGQNLAAGHGNWRQAMSNWYDEVADYRYGENVNDYLGPDGFFKIGHYTQIDLYCLSKIHTQGNDRSTTRSEERD